MTNGESVGDALRSAREARKLTIAQVHQDTKISVDVLESLEQDDFGSFASEMYLKGFLRNYAQFLGLDSDKLWGRISRKRDDTGEAAAGAFWDVEERVREERLTSPRIFKRFVLPVLIVIIIVLAALLVRERRKVESLTTGFVGRGSAGEVVTIVTAV